MSDYQFFIDSVSWFHTCADSDYLSVQPLHEHNKLAIARQLQNLGGLASVW